MPENKTENMTPLSWINEDIPKSERFDDTYYSKLDGLSETRHVFIECNDLPARFAKANNFTIAELGFGTGLNFLATLEVWQNSAPDTACLNFISFEQFPMDQTQMLKALSRWPALNDTAERLAGEWQNAINTHTPVFHLQWTRQISLTVYLDDANRTLPDLDLAANAWYLDGFSPAKNTELWNQELLNDVYAHTASQGTFATYTAAGWVRRNLIQAGFEVKRVKGHGHKREMMVGCRS